MSNMNKETTRDIYTIPAGWNGARLPVIEKLFERVSEHFDEVIMNARNSDIVVIQSRKIDEAYDYPMLLERENYSLILLSAQENFWAKFVYQFSHEYMHYHIAREFKPRNDNFAWFEESLCELSSLYMLRKLSSMDFDDGLIESYKSAFANYYDITVPDTVDLQGVELNRAIKNYESVLSKNRVERKFNMTVALQILSYFEDNPMRWSYVRYLNKVEDGNCKSFKDYINAWQDLLPEKDKQDFDWLKIRLLG